MGPDAFDKHQLAGLDDRERGFSRPVEFERDGEQYRAILRYETMRISTESQVTQDAALLTLVQTLQAQGYRQLRTQVSFQRGVYLGSQAMWVEYPDPPYSERKPLGLFARLSDWLRFPRPANRSDA